MLDIFYPSRLLFLLAVREARAYAGRAAYPLARIHAEYVTVCHAGPEPVVVARAYL